MKIEREMRYRLRGASAERIERMPCQWSIAEVVDVTFGRFGPASMARDWWVVRVRSTDGDIQMNVKSRLDEATWSETALAVSATVGQCAKFLRAIELKPGLLISRTRARAAFGDVALFRDDVRWIGRFLEIEGEDEAIVRTARTLGLDDSDAELAYGDLLARALSSDPELAALHDAALNAWIRSH